MVRRNSVRLAVALLVMSVVAPFVSSGTAGAIGSPPSTTIGARLRFATASGDILAFTKVPGTSRNLIAFGGNFTKVITPDGVSRDAKNFAVVDEFTGALVYGGNANNYVRAITSLNGTSTSAATSRPSAASPGPGAALNLSFAVAAEPQPGWVRARRWLTATWCTAETAASCTIRPPVAASGPRASRVARSDPGTAPNGTLYIGGMFEARN